MDTILITGAAKGFGAEIARALAANKHDVVIHYRSSAKEAEETAQKCREFGVAAETIFGDFTSQSTLTQFLEKYLKSYPKTKGLVNNVGNYLIAPASKTSRSEWLDLFQTNLHVPIALIQELLPSLKRAKGAIINVGVSGLSTVRANSYATAYMASKMALYQLTRSLARELAPEHITVNMVSPGVLETAVDIEKVKDVPMERAATLQEAARVITFLFEEENRYITGQNIEVAGGYCL